MWRENSSDLAKTAPFEASVESGAFYTKLQELSPKNDFQRSLHARAIQTSTDVAQTRLLLFAQTTNSIPMPFLVVLIFWPTIIFASFSLLPSQMQLLSAPCSSLRCRQRARFTWFWNWVNRLWG
jgi:hypothetical protein